MNTLKTFALTGLVLTAVGCAPSSDDGDGAASADQALADAGTRARLDAAVARCFSAERAPVDAACLALASDAALGARALGSFHATAKMFCEATVREDGPLLDDEGNPIALPESEQIASCLVLCELDIVALLRVHLPTGVRDGLAGNDDLVAEILPDVGRCGSGAPTKSSNACVARVIAKVPKEAATERRVEEYVAAIRSACMAFPRKELCVKDGLSQVALALVGPL